MHPEAEPSEDELLAMSQNMHLQSPEELRRNLDKLLAALPEDVRQQFLQHEIDARSRPATVPLAAMPAAEVRALSGEALENAVREHVMAQLEEAGPAALRRLPQALQVFFLSCVVEHEVRNGGLAQFFWNSSGDFSDQVAPALRALGAADAAALFDQALEVAHSEAQQRAALQRDGAWDAYVQYKNDSFLRTFDPAFAAMLTGLPQRRAAYFIANQDQFIVLPG